jgi:four helix bundle protein
MIKSFRDLEVYQVSMDLIIEVYKIVNKLPKNETYDLGSQLRRSTVSIPANIAEGWAKRRHPNEFKHHIDIALGSLSETQVHLLICTSLMYVKSEETELIINRYETLGARLTMLRNNWKSF